MCALRRFTFHAIQRFAECALVIKQKTHHDGRKHQCFTPQMESMLTEAERSCATLSMAFFLEKCCVIARTTPSQTAPKQTNNQPSSNTADMQQSINVHLCSPLHLNPSTETAWHTHRTIRIDVFRRQTTHGHTRTHTQTNKGMVGREVGRDRTEIIGKSNMNMYLFFSKNA